MTDRDEQCRVLQLLKAPRGRYSGTKWTAIGGKLVVKFERGTYTIYQQDPYKQVLETKRFSRVESLLENYANGWYNVSCINCDGEVEGESMFGYEDVVECNCTDCTECFVQPVRSDKVKQGKWF